MERLAETNFFALLNRHLVDGSIGFRIGARSFCAGTLAPQGALVSVVVHRPRMFSRLLSAGNLGLGEAYMDGDFDLEQGRLEDFISMLLRNRLDEHIRGTASSTLLALLLRTRNLLRGRDLNVRTHYDLGDDLFDACLDPSLTYSCGYALDPADDLEGLQRNKFDRICHKLQLRNGHRLLDIGCGFGGLLAHAVEHFGVTGTGITNSCRHAERGARRMRESGLSGRVQILFRDYREFCSHAQYDRIVSVGMMEHVPRGEYRRYFRVIRDALSFGGLGLVHTLGTNAHKNGHDPFIQKYIFPGSGMPRLSEISDALERSDLLILDVENCIRHYSLTLKRWLSNFRANRSRLNPVRYDAKFLRMWEYYLCCATAASQASEIALYQVLFTNDRATSIPLRRV